MEALLTYNIKLSVCFILFYSLYRILFSGETFYRANRLLLISICIFTLFIPFITFEVKNTNPFLEKIHSYQQVLAYTPDVNTEITNTEDELQITQSVVKTEVQSAQSINWINIVSFIYLAGIIALFVKLLTSIARIVLLIYKHKKIKLDRGTLIIHPKSIAPFSWFNYIFISEDDYNRNGEIIIKHEQAHIASRHTIDLILAEIVSIFQWYNPIMRFIKKELQDIHEFEADKLSIESGIDAKEYQLLLIKEAVGPLRFKSITNNFNQSKTKKRITMMLKEKSKPGNRWKYLAILPLVALSITLFAQPKASKAAKVVAEVTTSIQSDNYKDIEGTWKLIKSNHHDLSRGQSSLRFITKNNFSWTMSDAEGLIIASSGGKYTYKNGVYTEYLDYTSNAMAPWKGKKAVLNVEVKNNVMTCKGLLGGKVHIDEEWVRVE